MSLKDSCNKLYPYFVDFRHGQYPVGVEPACADELPDSKQENIL